MPIFADDDAMPAWQAADAERNFARLVEAAQNDPQLLLKQAEPVGIVMSVEHYRKLTAQADAEFARFLRASPLEDSDFDDGVGMTLDRGG